MTISRRVRIIWPDDQKGNIISLDEALSYPNLVLLGDPGAGKSFEFDRLSQVECGELFTAREFEVEGDSTPDQATVYIDALDEKRPRSSEQDAITPIARNLAKSNPSKVRISCRAADWLGETDLQLFKRRFEANGGYAVVSLEPLKHDEAISLIAGLEDQSLDPESFINEAKIRGVEDLLENPQTLLMLHKVIEDNETWPRSVKDLYAKSAELLLHEHNNVRAQKSNLTISKADIREAAGAICAIMLIADIDGLALQEAAETPTAPSVANLKLVEPDQAVAALSRRLFRVDDAEVARPVHRTVAEFLAAKWLAELIRKGFPLSRVRNFLGAEGEPTPELKGVHAWLAALMPENALPLIMADPYGVLVYGDAASLSTKQRLALLEALQALSARDPWFRKDDWSNASIGRLAGPDMADRFQAILTDTEVEFSLRSIVLEALLYGGDALGLENQLLTILEASSGYAERKYALEILLNSGDDGALKAVAWIKSVAFDQLDTVRLASLALADFFEPYFCADDVARLLSEAGQIDSENMVGALHRLRYLPHHAARDILNALVVRRIHNDSDKRDFETLRSEVMSGVARFSLIALRSDPDVTPSELLGWLNLNEKYDDFQSLDSEWAALRDYLRARPELITHLFGLAIDQWDQDERPVALWIDFQRITAHAYDPSALCDVLITRLYEGNWSGDFANGMCRLAFLLLFQSKPPAEKQFMSLVQLKEQRPELACVIQQELYCDIPEWVTENAERSQQRQAELRESLEKGLETYEREKNLIRSGEHMGWLSHLAFLALCRVHDQNKKINRFDIIRDRYGEEAVQVSKEGFRAILKSEKLESAIAMLKTHAKNQWFPSWLALIAGADEIWNDEGSLNAYSDVALEASYTANLLHGWRIDSDINAPPGVGDWVQAIHSERPDIAEHVFEQALLNTQFAKKTIPHDLVQHLCDYQDPSNWRVRIAIALLRKWPSMQASELTNLLRYIIRAQSAKCELISVVSERLGQPGKSKGSERALLLGTGFVLDYEAFRDRLRSYVKSRPQALFDIKRLISPSYREEGFLDGLSVVQIGFLIEQFSSHFEYVPEPSGARDRDGSFDKSEFVRGLIRRLSTHTSQDAAREFDRLLKLPQLTSYNEFLRHYAALNRAARLEANFEQAGFYALVDAFANEAPANIADLHAWTVADLGDYSELLQNGNTDGYKAFWNEAPFGREVESPKVEDSCRDRLLDYLRTRFARKNVIAEPEGHYADDKRADITLTLAADVKLPIELKRDFHSDVWTACQNQLERLYASDPNASGYGVFGVFWFGPKRSKPIPAPPNGIPKPSTATEMQSALQSLVPEASRQKISIVIIDVSPPDSEC